MPSIGTKSKSTVKAKIQPRTKYEAFGKRWGRCRACRLHRHRRNIVLARGIVPADILFVGEAPGISEDCLGRPFVGPAGKLLDLIIQDGLEDEQSYALTNLVCCMPQEEDEKIEPPKEAIEACAPRLKEFTDLVQPKAIVCVGRLSSVFTVEILSDRLLDTIWCHLVHPAAILRAESNFNIMVKRSVRLLKNMMHELDQARRRAD